MLMNCTTIEKYTDFQEVLDTDILITGDLTRQKEELYTNTWNLSFEHEFVQQLAITDLQQFIEKVVQTRIEQLHRQNNYTPVTFYVWFDEMALQLCFDFLSGKNIRLPFYPGNNLNIISSVDPILKAFLAEAQRVAVHGNLQDFKIINPGDPGWDENDDDIGKDWILDVYVKTLES